ncbi:MAG TPA: prepilin-type N-terminal cleavage/methylation domain-containing protein [Arenicellales bacterium]|jgi:type IV pilus assembly protein PilA|nr:prepilin-type N-terminal cleavage/methylation domain-containing protein [Arenicellales bacterium]
MKQKGFGLMELLVVVGIIAILGAIALPQYNKYVTKTRIAEALHAGQVYARKVESEAAGGGSAGTEPTVDLATITRTGSGADTRVNITLSEEIDSQALIAADEADLAGGKVLELAPTGSGSAIRWDCTSNLPDSKIPKVCTYSADAGAGLPTAWVDRDTSDSSLTACWEGEAGERTVGRWVVGENSHAGSQGDVRTCADGGTPLSDCTAGRGVAGTVRCSD